MRHAQRVKSREHLKSETCYKGYDARDGIKITGIDSRRNGEFPEGRSGFTECRSYLHVSSTERRELQTKRVTIMYWSLRHRNIRHPVTEAFA